jgi:hypothetical protein
VSWAYGREATSLGITVRAAILRMTYPFPESVTLSTIAVAPGGIVAQKREVA